MKSGVARKLVFRLAEIGFTLELSSVVEIREQVVETLDSSCRDLAVGIVGALDFRQTWIPVVDPMIHFGLQSTLPLSRKSALILNSSEGNWALLVDRVGEIHSASSFGSCEIPPIFRIAVSKYYSRIELYDNEPLVLFEPERFYGATGLTL